jgi:hypothetical protein
MRKTFFISLITINISFILLSTSYSSDWVYIDSDKTGDKNYIDLDTVEFNGPIATFWVKNIDKKGEEMSIRYSIHCKNKMAAIRDIFVYGLDGAILKSYSPKDDKLKWLKIPYDSISNSFYKFLCSGRQQ